MNNTETIKLKIKGMHCASCAKSIENILKNLNGVSKVNVNFVTKQAIIEYDEVKINLEKIKKEIKKLGYEIEATEKKEKFFYKYLSFIRLISAGIFLLFSWLAGFFHWEVVHLWSVENLFAIFAIIIGFLPILKNAIKTVLLKRCSGLYCCSVCSFCKCI